MRLAAASCLLASGLLVAGTGASLALADPDTGNPADTGGSEHNSAPPATGSPEATGSSGASAPGSAPGGTGSPSKPSSQVGDGRNGVPEGGTTGTATAHETTHESTHESASPTETAPTTVTETSSKLPETASTPAPQTGSASPSEQSTGVTTHVTVAPSVPTAALPQALAAASEKLAAAAEEVVPTDTPTTTAAPVWWPFNWWNWAIPQVVTPNSGSDGLPAPVTWQSPIPPGMQLPIPQFPTIPRDLLAPIGGISFDPFVDAVNGVLTGVNNVVTGLATAASQLPFAQITLPVVVFPGGPVASAPNSNGGSVDARGPGVVPRLGIPEAPLSPGNPGASSAPPPPPPPAQKQQSPPAFSASNEASVAPSYRMGYMEYLRAAGFGEVAAVAVPGFTGILILTGAGGLIGYRQARAGSTMRTGNTARFMG
jgi:hypothetical protein